MKNKCKKIGISMILVGFLLFGIQTGSAQPRDVLVQPATTATIGWLYVGGGGPGNYTTIQSAINAAVDDDTIYVYAGTYHENIKITKSVRLLGQGRNVTTIYGNNLNATVEMNRQKVALQGFTIKNDGSQDGVYTDTSASYHTFANNIFTRTSHGISLFYSSENKMINNLFYDNTHSGVYIEVGENNTIFNNQFYNNTDEGLYITGCGKVYIENNSFYNNWIGIRVYRGNSNIFKNNIIQYNSYGILFEGILTQNSNYNTITRNRINYNTICGLRIENAQFNLIEFNEIKGNGRGIEFEVTYANVVRNNNISMSTIMEIMLTFSVADRIIQNNIDNIQESIVLVQMNLGFTLAANNWWGSTQWSLRRIRPLGGWVWILPWRMRPFNIKVGPEF